MKAPDTTATKIVVLSVDELRELIRHVVFDQMAEFLEEARKPIPLLDRAGLAQALGCSTATISRLVREGVPCVPLGDSRRFKLDEVVSWLQSRPTTGVE
jgi:hypothetical protein